MIRTLAIAGALLLGAFVGTAAATHCDTAVPNLNVCSAGLGVPERVTYNDRETVFVDVYNRQSSVGDDQVSHQRVSAGTGWMSPVGDHSVRVLSYCFDDAADGTCDVRTLEASVYVAGTWQYVAFYEVDGDRGLCTHGDVVRDGCNDL